MIGRATALSGVADGDIITIKGILNQWVIIDGFTITGGKSGIYSERASGTIAHNIIRDNGADRSGTGVCLLYSASTVANNFIIRNTLNRGSFADRYAAGIYAYNSDATVVNNTIAGNAISGNNRSPPVVDMGTGNVVFNNNIVALNSHGVAVSGYATPANNDVWGNTNENWLPDPQTNGPPDQNGNIIEDPTFFDVPSNDAHILWGICK